MSAALHPPTAFLGWAQPIRGGPASCTGPASGQGRPITDAPVHLMHPEPPLPSPLPANLPAQVQWIQAHYSVRPRPIRCLLSLSHAAWQTLELPFSRITAHVCIYPPSFHPPPSHDALQPYRQAFLSLSLSNPGFILSFPTMGAVLPP